MNEARTPLRSRTRALIRDEVRACALKMFATRGYDATTVGQIAEAAGISQSTFFRYFPTKEDVVIDEPPQYADRLREFLESRPSGEPAWDALRETMRLRTAQWQSDLDVSRQVVALLARSEALRARHRQKIVSWERALVPETMRRLGKRDKLAAMRAHAVVSTVFACLDAAFQEWQRDDTRSLDGLFDAALSVVRS